MFKTTIMKLLLFVFVIVFSNEIFAQNCNEPNALVSVRKRKTGHTEYVIFTLQNPVTATNTITGATPPFTQDPSGQTVHVSGCRYKKVSFRDIVWTCKVKEIMSNTYLVKQVKNIGQFEGHIDYVIGYKCSTKSVVHYQYTTGNLTKLVVRLRY
jgi:hypothetical protein